MKNQESNSNVLTRLLPDSIPEKDAFGGHEKVAKAIFELINEEEKGGKAIALSGSFGSGKSTVIDFLKRKFTKEEKRNNEETGIFIFDAWEHQGNPLRRAFIEKYIDFLRDDELKWAGKNEWKEELELVSENREEIETTTKPSVTTLGGLFALTILLLPLGLASVRLGLVPEQAEWLLNIGFSLLLLPTILLLGIYVCWRPIRSKHWTVLKEEFDLDDFLSKNFYKYIWYFLYHHRPNNYKKSIFNFVVKESTEDIETTSLKSPDPTTIEFQKLFGKITKRVLKDENRRLIIVIDNIDRLTTKSSINAWTTLRAFFESDNKDWEWKDQFWLIAPFDFQALKKLWSGLDHLNNSENSVKTQNTSDYLQAFIDKTFQITFRVPQPVLSDWKTYFKDQLRKAFPNIKDENVFNDITTLYQLKGIKGGESPTPRDIKQFINRVIAQYRIWHEEINLPALAYYELVVDVDQENVVKKLQSGDLVDSTFKSIIGEKELNRKLAAIHFNCEVNKAYQVLFGDQVATALQEGEAEILEEYYETDGFLDVLNYEFYELKGGGVPQSLANCAICLSEIEENSEHVFKNYFHQLSNSLREVTSFKLFNGSIGKGIVTIWEKTGFGEDWITSILKNLSHAELDKEEITIENWFSLMKPILESLSKKDVSHLLKENLKIPGGANEYINFLSLFNELEVSNNRELAVHLKPNSQSNQIVQTYSNILNSDEIPHNLGEALYLQSFDEDEIGASEWSWDDLITQIKSMIKVNTNAHPEQVAAALKMMLVLCYKLNISGAIQLSEDSNFKNGLLFLIKNPNVENFLGLLVLCSILFNPNNEKTVNDNKVNQGLKTLNNILSNPSDKKFIKKGFFNFLIEFELLGNFLEVQHGNNNLRSLPKFIIQELFNSEKALERIDADMVFEYFDDFYQTVDEDSLSDHIKALYDSEDDVVNRIIEEFDTIPLGYKLHYYFAKACPEELREPYSEFLAEGLRNMGQDEWLSHLIDETELIKLVIMIQQSGFDLELSVKFKDALEEHYKQLYAGKIEPPSEALISNWNNLLSSLDEDVRQTFLKGIKYHIETNQEGMVANIGSLYDSILIDEGIYLTETDRFISTVLTRVLKTNNEVELTWLKELIKEQPAILEQHESATKAFKAEIEYFDRKNYSDEAAKIVDDIAEILDVDMEGGFEENKNEE
jgi:Cdc6-like AAA superfamily ATPase